MMAQCKGRCQQNKINKNPSLGSMFALGFKKCSICGVFFDQTELNCICCKTLLATKPKSKRSKINYEKTMRIGRY